MAEKTTLGNGHHKDFVQDETNEWGKRLAEEARQRQDAKEAFKDDYVTHTMQVSRDDVERLAVVIQKHPNAGQFKKVVEFLQGDKGHWTKELTLEIKDHDEELDDYVNAHEDIGTQISELEEKLLKLKTIKENRDG